MKAVLSSLLTALLAVVATGAESPFDVTDPVAGTYYGNFKTRTIQGVAEAQIRALGNNTYDGVIALKYEKDDAPEFMTIGIIHEFKMENGSGRFNSSHPNQLVREQEAKNPEFIFPLMVIEGDIGGGRMTGVIHGGFLRRGDTSVSLLKTTPKPSPTLGAEPPANAVVLFDGESTDKWKDVKWNVADGVLEVGKGNVTTKQSFTNALLHIEFRTPFMPEARGQARGNSGVYLRSVFEVQVLDSFGKFPLESNDAGGIYQVAAPDWRHVNACLPPGEWQTYDITFRDGSEKERRLPTVSVMHNGKVVVRNAQIPADLALNGTGGGEVDGGFLMLQDHGNPVQFRNIWVQPID